MTIWTQCGSSTSAQSFGSQNFTSRWTRDWAALKPGGSTCSPWDKHRISSVSLSRITSSAPLCCSSIRVSIYNCNEERFVQRITHNVPRSRGMNETRLVRECSPFVVAVVVEVIPALESHAEEQVERHCLAVDCNFSVPKSIVKRA